MTPALVRKEESNYCHNTLFVNGFGVHFKRDTHKVTHRLAEAFA
jgi:hypothetical protein